MMTVSDSKIVIQLLMLVNVLRTLSVESLVDITTTNTHRDWITQPNYDYLTDAAYGVVGRTLYILGGGNENYLQSTTRTLDLDTLTFSTLSVAAPESFELWSRMSVTVGSDIYYARCMFNIL